MQICNLKKPQSSKKKKKGKRKKWSFFSIDRQFFLWLRFNHGHTLCLEAQQGHSEPDLVSHEQLTATRHITSNLHQPGPEAREKLKSLLVPDNATLPQSLNGRILSVHTRKRSRNHVFWLSHKVGIFSTMSGASGHTCMCTRVCSVAKLHPTLCDPSDCGPPGSSVHVTSQARILKWVVISFSRVSFWDPQGSSGIKPMSPALAGWFFTTEPPGKVPTPSSLDKRPLILWDAYEPLLGNCWD